MSWLTFFLLLNAVIFVFGFARHALRNAAFPLTLLVVLAISGGLGTARNLILVRTCGKAAHDGVTSQLWRYMPGPVAFALAIWLAIEIYCRFSAPGARRQCRTCGYDLSGNTSGTCPECGKEVLNSMSDGR